MLARRELSEAQVRDRLARRGHESAAVDEAVDRLKEERALDDTRTAEAIARRETVLRQRGRLRVRLEIERAGISAALARRIVDDVFATIDDDAVIAAVIEKRLRGRELIDTDQEYRRLFRYLLAQGFDADRVSRALHGKRSPRRPG